MNTVILSSQIAQVSYYDELINFERSQIERVLCATEGNVKKAAKLMGMSRTTLIYRIARLGLNHLKNKKEKEK